MNRYGAIGILGGTFNPVHLGHLILAQAAFEACDLERVLFVPCANPPHKRGSALAPARHRRAMLEMALEGDPRFELCDIELERGGLSYTVDTIRELTRQFPDRELHFIIGSDSLPELHLWKDVYTLLELCRFAVFCRPGFGSKEELYHRIQLDPPWPDRLKECRQGGYLVEISSSEIRHRVAEGMSIRYLVPHEVGMYISEHSLYGSTQKYQ